MEFFLPVIYIDKQKGILYCKVIFDMLIIYKPHAATAQQSESASNIIQVALVITQGLTCTELANNVHIVFI